MTKPRRKISKADRKLVYNKTGGRCAYCGKELGKKWNVDHVESFYKGGACELDNFLPSCPRCNSWKHSFSLEEFRNEIAQQVARLRRYSSGFRLAEDFGMVEAQEIFDAVFYFETIGVPRRKNCLHPSTSKIELGGDYMKRCDDCDTEWLCYTDNQLTAQRKEKV